MFHDRREAGRLLAEKLERYRGAHDVVVVGLPRGGVVCADEIAKALELPLDIIVPRKIGAPENKEFAIGAITEDEMEVLDDDTIETLNISRSSMKKAIEREMREAKRRLATYRHGRPPLDLSGKTVIIVDDGIATGLTMRASIQTAQRRGATKIVIAVPVLSNDTVQLLVRVCDELVYLDAPTYFGAVGMFYERFNQITDEEVMSTMNKRR